MTVTVAGSASAGTNPMLGAFVHNGPLDGAEVYPAAVQVYAAPLALPQDVLIPEPDPAWMGDVVFGGEGLVVLILAWDDLNGNGVHDSGEPILGGSHPMPTWNEVAGPYEYPTGWHAAIWTSTPPLDQEPILADLASNPPILEPVPQSNGVSASGTSTSLGVTLEADRIMALSALESSPLPGRPVNLPLPAVGEPFSFDVTEPSDPSRVQSYGPFAEYALEYVVALPDLDGDGEFDVNEAPAASICVNNDEAVGLLWLGPTSSPEAWWSSFQYDLHPGWTLVALDSGDVRATDPAEASGLFTATPLEQPCGALP